MMKFKVLFLLSTLLLIQVSVNAQRGVRIGYIDTEYILENVPDYTTAASQLDTKVAGWKTDIEKQLGIIAQKKKELEIESVLLTKELYDERAEDISFEEAKVIDYQQNLFGPNGSFMSQKRQLIKPIQDQIFAAVQEIAELKKYDFIFDKSADVVMLYSAERYDISEQVLKTITRTSKRKQVKNKKERKAIEDEAVVPEIDNGKDERQKALEERKAAKEAQLEKRKTERAEAAAARKKELSDAREAKKLETAQRRQKALDARNKKNGTPEEGAKNTAGDRKKQLEDAREAKKRETAERRQKALEARKKRTESPEEGAKNTAGDRKKQLEDAREAKKRETSERRQKALDARKKRTETPKTEVETDVEETEVDSKVKASNTTKVKTTAELLEEKRLQKLKDREARKNALDARRKKILDDKKKAREARLKKIKETDSIAKAKKSTDGNN